MGKCKLHLNFLEPSILVALSEHAYQVWMLYDHLYTLWLFSHQSFVGHSDLEWPMTSTWYRRSLRYL